MCRQHPSTAFGHQNPFRVMKFGHAQVKGTFHLRGTLQAEGGNSRDGTRKRRHEGVSRVQTKAEGARQYPK